MNRDKLLVLLYFFAWVFVFFFRLGKKKRIDAPGFLMLSYAIYAFSSFMLLGTSYYFLPLRVLPFLYLFVMLLVGMSPVLFFDTSGNIPIRIPSLRIINILSIVYIVSTLFYFPKSVSSLAEGMSSLLSDMSAGMEMYNESQEDAEIAGHGISNLASIISNSFSQIGLFLTVFYLTLPKNNKWILIGLFMASFMKMAGGVSSGTRGTIVEPLLILVATYFLLRYFIQPRYKRLVLWGGGVILGLLLVPVVLITISRFDNKYSDPTESTLFYLGQENLIFNNYAFDDGGIRYGDRTVMLFKKALGFPDVPSNFVERREKYPYLKVNDEVFITYVGDILIDFGVFVGTLLILLFSILFSLQTRLKAKAYGFHQLLLVHFVLYMCTIGGIKLFPYSDVGGNLKIVVFIIAFFVFKYHIPYQNSISSIANE